ncbi:GNAT family N-acetyltransferase [Pseudoalteromonas sp. SMS1]|uniref:GNAT family N-acetyltransferase n=1 Tax=Pseudoalteromonas sp. SMS1 TaxID=2908894 RepID=UPI001F4507DB|nr:GNAT family N-acetyltransferase [Pseudoalteromonas sp. SMS1]MCF2858032.1 GNAT family N-acetyltransferase [Pseudoalteromonas sp. SMS1]
MTIESPTNARACEEVMNGVEYATLSQAPKSTTLSARQKQHCQFQASMDAPIWPTVVSETPFNQAWIHLYVTAILAWLHEAQDSQLLDTTKPVYLLQAGSGTYRCGLSILHKLQQAIAAEGLNDIALCMIFTVEGDYQQNLLVNHPDFGYFYEQQQALIVDWDITCPNDFPLIAIDGSKIDAHLNPMVFIAHGIFSQLPQAIYHVHYHQLYHAEFATVGPADEFGDGTVNADDTLSDIPLLWSLKKPREAQTADEPSIQQLAVRWQKVQRGDEVDKLSGPLAPWLDSLLSTYLMQGASKTVAIPLAAAGVLSNIEKAFPQGVIHLVSDDFQSEHGLTLTQSAQPRNTTLAVDLKRLFMIYESDFQIQSIKLPNGNQSLTLALRHDKSATFNYVSYAFEHACRTFPPDSQTRINCHLKNTVDTLQDAQIQAYIVQSQYDPQVLAIFLTRLIEEGVPVNSRSAWRNMLTKVWENHIVDCENEVFAFQLGLFAIDLAHWTLAKTCMLMRMEINGPSSACLHNLALAAWATGDMEVAKQSINLALDLNSQDKQVQQLKADMSDYLKRCERLPWFDWHVQSQQSKAAPIKIMPLCEQQLGEFFIQYRRPDIAERLRGVRFRDFKQLKMTWPTWLEEQLHAQKAHFAVIHAEFGFVGAVVIDFAPCEPGNSNEQGHGAHLSFWIGCDFQKRGFGRLSVALAISHIKYYAKKLGVSNIHTSAWSHNIISRKILSDTGFKSIELKKGKEVTEEVFYRIKI